MTAHLIGRIAVALTRWAHRRRVHAPARSFDDGVTALITELDKQDPHTR